MPVHWEGNSLQISHQIYLKNYIFDINNFKNPNIYIYLKPECFPLCFMIQSSFTPGDLNNVLKKLNTTYPFHCTILYISSIEESLFLCVL